MRLQTKAKNYFSIANLSDYIKIENSKKNKNITVSDKLIIAQELNFLASEICFENYYN